MQVSSVPAGNTVSYPNEMVGVSYDISANVMLLLSDTLAMTLVYANEMLWELPLKYRSGRCDGTIGHSFNK